MFLGRAQQRRHRDKSRHGFDMRCAAYLQYEQRP